MHERKKQILMLGGLGVIGRVLWQTLARDYELLVGDLAECPTDETMNYRRIDSSDYEELCNNIPQGTSTIVHLAGMSRQARAVDVQTFHRMMTVYAQSTYNVLQAACATGVEKVILASTNHVTGMNEQDGVSLLGHEIDAFTYPKPDDIYGGFKLAQESWGRVISDVNGLSVICLRIGTVVENEGEALKSDARIRHTLLSHIDCAELFKCAIETDTKFGVYYGVSDNPHRPWSIRNTEEELQYKPIRNSVQVLASCE